jgi:hypothetical protein
MSTVYELLHIHVRIPFSKESDHSKAIRTYSYSDAKTTALLNKQKIIKMLMPGSLTCIRLTYTKKEKSINL